MSALPPSLLTPFNLLARLEVRSAPEKSAGGAATTSASRSQADIGAALAHVSKGPFPDSCTAVLFDHLVGAGKQRWRHSEAERVGGLQVNHQLEVGRLQDGHFRWI